VKKRCLSREWGEHALDGLLVCVLLIIITRCTGCSGTVITVDNVFSGFMTELHASCLDPRRASRLLASSIFPVGTSAIYPHRACPIVAVVRSIQRLKGEAGSLCCISNHSIFNRENLFSLWIDQAKYDCRECSTSSQASKLANKPSECKTRIKASRSRGRRLDLLSRQIHYTA